MDFLALKSKARKFLSKLGLRPILLPPLRLLNSLFFKVFSRKAFQAFIEQPIGEVTTPYLLLKGFVITNTSETPKGFWLRDDKTGVKTELFSTERFDLRRNFRFQNSVSFSSPALVIDDRPEFHYTLIFKLGEKSCEHEFALKNSANVKEFFTLKTEKLRRIFDLLQSPITKSTNLILENEKILVDGKDQGFTHSSLLFDFLSPQLREEMKIVQTDNISSMDYFDAQKDLISKTKGGLVLDHGCGLKIKYHPQVVYYDIADYPTTDVRGMAENLPFRDGVFDAVLSHAVLEHVQDPFKCALEILRVLKPGGVMLIAAAFLQPLHAYPHHYYNMSLAGLLNLFGDRIDVQKTEAGHPIHALSWFINSYLKGLPEKEQKHFLKSRIRDFELEDEAMDQSYAKAISESAKNELATWYSIIAKKS